ncbi:hypothetical protein HRbin10_02572 [bacterium HR10]|nr:hypothetical protein HRbin10_02572 [bacterium HR10]
MRLLDLQAARILGRSAPGKDLHVNDRALDPRRAFERGIADIARLLAEDGAQQLLLGRELPLALGGHLPHQDRTWPDVSADANDAALIQVAEHVLGHVRDVARDLLRTELRLARLDLQLLDMDRRVSVVLDELLRDHDGVLEVIPAPGHEGDQDIAPERQLPLIRARTVGDDIPPAHALAHAHNGPLIDARILIRPLEFDQWIDIRRHLAREDPTLGARVGANDDALRIHIVHDAIALGDDHRARILRHDGFHAGPHNRRLRTQQRHRLALHVRSHERPVGIVMLQEGDERGGHRDHLLRRDVNELHLLAAHGHELSTAPRDHPLGNDVPLLIHLDVGLRDHIARFLPRRQIERIGLVLGWHLALGLKPPILAIHLLLGQMLTEAERALARIEDAHVVHDAPVLDLAIWRLDEAELIDASVAGQAGDQSDVRPLGRLNRTDAPVVRRMHIAHFESRALARQTARPQGREPPLVRDLGQRIGLIHELRELTGAEELLERRHDGLRIDEIARHGRLQLPVHGHLLLDRSLHPHQPHAELILQQLADRTHAPVPQMIAIIHLPDVLPQLEEIADDVEEILRRERQLIQPMALGIPHLDVELQAPDAREVELARIEEHALEQAPGGEDRRRIPGPHLPIDLQERFGGRARRILPQRLTQRGPDVIALREEEIEFGDAAADDAGDRRRRDRRIRLGAHLASRVHEIGDEVRPLQISDRDLDFADLGRQQLPIQGRGDLPARAHKYLPRARMHDVLRRMRLEELQDRLLRMRLMPKPPIEPTIAHEEALPLVELAQQLLIREPRVHDRALEQLVVIAQGRHVMLERQSERPQERRPHDLPLLINPHVEDALGIILELDPRPAIGDDLAQVGVNRRLLEVDARTPVQLRDDDPLRPVDDERPVLRHERDLAEIDLLLLDVAHLSATGLLVHVEDRQPKLHLHRHGVGHAPLAALLHVVLQLQPHRLPAMRTEIEDIRIERPTLVAEDVLGRERIQPDERAALATGRAQMAQPFQLTALATPGPNGILHEVQLRRPPVVGDREDREEDRLQPRRGITLLGQSVHLHEPIVRLALQLNEVRNGDRGLDPREIHALARLHLRCGHSTSLLTDRSNRSASVADNARTRDARPARFETLRRPSPLRAGARPNSSTCSRRIGDRF